MRFTAVYIVFSLCLMQSAIASDAKSIQASLKTSPVTSIETAPKSLAKKFYIGLIIDDMGYRYQSGKRAINLPANITYSFLPYAPHARKLANLANKNQKEIMLHLPMEAKNGKALGPGGLTVAMSKPVFDLELQHNLSAIPYIKGVNNHMGSLLTQRLEPMIWLMEKLVEKQIYFVDSRTSEKSMALKTARQFGIRSETRDIFVDHDLNEKSMNHQLALALDVARRNGSAVVIAHPFPETMKVLEKWLPEAQAEGFEFIYMSQMFTIRNDIRAQRKQQKRLTQWKIQRSQIKNN